MSTDSDRDDARARKTIAAALVAGVTVFDTAHAYGRGEAELGHNERLLAGALRGPGAVRGRGPVRRDRGTAHRDRADRHQGRHDPTRRRRGCPTAAPRLYGGTAKRASPRSTACRSICT